MFHKTIVLIASSLFICAFRCQAQTTPPVPAQYQDIYDTVNTGITNFSSTIHSAWDGSTYPVIYSAQLQTASSDLTTGLLAPNYYQYTVVGQLNDLQALGVTAITFHINFPALLPSYYSNSADYQAYLNFYIQLVNEIHGRGLKVIIENTTSSPYPGSNAASSVPYYQGIDWNTYITQRAQTAANIAQVLRPDYLVVQAEPDTESTQTFQPNAGTVSGSAQLVQSILTAVRNADAFTVKVGAGCGSWNPSFLQFEQSFASMPLDFVDMHIYPVNRSFLPNALQAAQAIAAAGKQSTISEMWAYKIDDEELGVLDYTTVYSRDPFSFWQPLDQEFLQTMSDFANYQHFTFVSPFWSTYFANYLAFDTYGSLAPADIIAAQTTAGGDAVSIGAYTPTAATFESLTTPGPDVTAPAVPAPPAFKSASQTMVNLTWNATTDNVGVAGYNIYRNGSLLTSFNGPLAYTDQTAQPFTTYTYSIAAFDATGNISAQSAPITVTTLRNQDTNPPSVPTGLTVVASTDTQMNLTWSPANDDYGVTGYEIYRGTSPSSLVPWAVTPTNSFLDTKASPSTVYYYAVDAYDSFNNHSAKSTAVKGTTLADTVPPSTPSPVTASVAAASVTLNWGASTDDYAVGSFKIFRGTSTSNMQAIAAVTNAVFTYSDTKAVSGKTYYYSVTAVDIAKNSSVQSAPMLVTVP